MPEWYAVPSLRYPLRLSAEQCSSAQTARYKAAVALSAVSDDGPLRLADLTGGLGVDSWAFAQLFDAVLYNEMRPELAAAAAFNFRELGMDNVSVRNCQLGKGFPVKPGMTEPVMADGGPKGGQGVMACSEGAPGVMAGFDRPSVGVLEVLDGFRPDILYLDPARRAADGRKVFRLEDCQPDVLQLLPELLDACPKLLLKLSPMADISLVCRQLGCVKEVHVVASEGECKELLLLLEKGHEAPYRLLVWEDGAGLEILRDAQQDNGERSDEESVFGRGVLLFEPGKGLLKAGAFELPCQLGLTKLGRHTHLYVGDRVPETLRPFGKVYEILEVQPLNNKTLKELGRRYPQAEVTARNLPLSSEQLRAKLGVHSGGQLHIFGIKADTIPSSILASAFAPTSASAMATTAPSANLLLVTRRGDK